MALLALFSFLALCLGAVAVWAGTAGSWVIAVTAAVIAAWFLSLAWSGMRKTRA